MSAPQTDIAPAWGPDRYRRILVLGAGGGVGRAFLSLLHRHPLGIALLRRVEQVMLLDRPEITVEADGPSSSRFRILPAIDIQVGRHLADIIRRHAIDLVIELADVDTRDCYLASAEAGADYISTSYNVWSSSADDLSDPRNCLIQRSQELQPERLPVMEKGTILIGTGMNPGLVNALVLRGLHDFARQVGCQPNAAVLDLYGIYLTEVDATNINGDAGKVAFPMTWNPYHALEELTVASTAFMRRGHPRFLPRPPHADRYRVRVLDREVETMLVPHEEVVTLGHRFAQQEVAFLYQIPEPARRALDRHPERHPREWCLYKLYPPYCRDLRGSDIVGALLCSRRYGEFWLGFHNRHSGALAMGTNATLLQVAAGVLAGWHCMPPDAGVILPEQLCWRSYLGVAEMILGPLRRHWAADARPARLADRLISGKGPPVRWQDAPGAQ